MHDKLFKWKYDFCSFDNFSFRLVLLSSVFDFYHSSMNLLEFRHAKQVENKKCLKSVNAMRWHYDVVHLTMEIFVAKGSTSDED